MQGKKEGEGREEEGREEGEEGEVREGEREGGEEGKRIGREGRGEKGMLNVCDTSVMIKNTHSNCYLGLEV